MGEGAARSATASPMRGVAGSPMNRLLQTARRCGPPCRRRSAHVLAGASVPVRTVSIRYGLSMPPPLEPTLAVAFLSPTATLAPSLNHSQY